MICPLLRFPHKNSPYIFIKDAPLPHNALPAAAKRRTTFCQNGMVTYMPNYDHSVNVAWTCYIPVSCAVSLSIKENLTFWLFFSCLICFHFIFFNLNNMRFATEHFSVRASDAPIHSTLNIASFYSPPFSAKREYPHSLTTFDYSYASAGFVVSREHITSVSGFATRKIGHCTLDITTHHCEKDTRDEDRKGK